MLAAIICHLSASIASATTSPLELQIEFSFDTGGIPGKTVTGYRLYKENILLCEAGAVVPQSITCTDPGEPGTYSFALSAVYNDGSESPKSEPFSLTIASKTATFTWDYTATATTITGFKIYQNDSLVCETLDPAARQLSCSITLAGTNVFRVTAVASGGTESTVSDSTVTIAEGPVAGSALAAIIVTTSPTGQAPFSLSFDGSKSTGTVSSYAWSFGDGETATSATTSHTYQAAGTYTATLTVTDATGQFHQNSLTITATEPTPPPVQNTPPTATISISATTGEAPFTIQFDGSGSTSAQPPIVSYSWDFGDGANANSALASHTYTVAGTYHPTLTVTDSVGLTNQTSELVTIAPPETENEPPIASFTVSPASGKAPLTVSFDASSSSDPDGSISGYVWSFGDGTTATGVSVQHTFVAIADYTVSLQVTDNEGVTADTTQTISAKKVGAESILPAIMLLLLEE